MPRAPLNQCLEEFLMTELSYQKHITQVALFVNRAFEPEEKFLATVNEFCSTVPVVRLEHACTPTDQGLLLSGLVGYQKPVPATPQT